MAPKRYTEKAADFSLASLVFFSILVPMLFVEVFAGTFFPFEFHALTDNLFIRVTTALLATLLVVSLLLRNRQFVIALKDRELRKAREDSEKTLNTLTDFISIHNKDFIVTRANNALCEFLGKRPEEIIGKPCYRVFHDRGAPYENCPHKKAIELGHPAAEIINDPCIGVPLQITCSPFFDEQGVFLGSLHAARVSEGINKRKDSSVELFPICAACKNIRNSDNEWLPFEDYFINKHMFQFTHTICKDCQKKMYQDFIHS